jgi:hypothetical protein
MATRTGRAPALPAAANGSHPRPPAAGLATNKRSAPMALVGVAAVVLGALLFLALYTSVDQRHSVLAVAQPVAAAADLRVVRVSSSEGVASMPASRSGDVVGKTAAVALVPGAQLAPAQVGVASTLQPGQAVVGIALKPGQAPASLRAGTRVEVIDTVKGAGGDQPRPVVLSTNAVVSSSARGDSSSSGTTLVSLTLPASEAPAVAAAAMDGQLSLVMLPVMP